MRKHLSILVFVLVVLHFVGMWCHNNLPVTLPLLDEVNESCHVTVLPVYKDMELDHKLKTLSGEEILGLKEFLQGNTYTRFDDGIHVGDDRYRITITWSDGRSVQLRTFGENPDGSDVFVWDGKDFLLVAPKEENWHGKLNQLLME